MDSPKIILEYLDWDEQCNLYPYLTLYTKVSFKQVKYLTVKHLILKLLRKTKITKKERMS